jgi:hypothetical protein
MTHARATRIGLLTSALVAAAAALSLAAVGDVALVSVSSGGTLGASPAEASAVSADGRHVAFTSAAALTATATGGKVQLYVRDRTAGITALASTSAGGAAADGDVDAQDVGNVQFSISGDGRYAVFASTATNLTAADTDAGKDVFRKDLTTGAVTLVSVNSAGAKANAGVFGDPDVSGDGTRISFGSGTATNLFPADATSLPTPANSDVVVRDIVAGTTVLAAQTSAGVQANGTTERSAISADGRAVTFEAPVGTTNLAPNDTGGGNDVFVRNLAAGTLSAASDPARTTGSGFPDISGDGRYVVLETGEKYDATNDVSAGNDVYRRDLGTGAIVLVSAKNGSDVGGATNGIRPQISADGGRVGFTSTSVDLVSADTNGVGDVFVRDVATKTTQRASVRADGTTQGSTASEIPSLSANGALVAFTFNDTGAATKLVTAPVADANSQPDIHAKEFAASDAVAPVVTMTGPAEGATQTGDAIAVGGTATDPSGVVSVTVNGAALPLTATGGFSTTVAAILGANVVTVRALDGSGNITTVTRSVTRTAAVTRKRPRLLGLSAVLTKAGTIRVKVRLSANARVRVRLLRRTVRSAPRRVVLRSIGTPVTKTLKAGRRTIILTPSRPLRPGRYVVRVRILGKAAGPSARTVGFRIRAR